MSRIERKKQASEEIKSEDNAEKKNNNADDVNDTDLSSAGVKEKNIFKRFKNWFTGLKYRTLKDWFLPAESSSL